MPPLIHEWSAVSVRIQARTMFLEHRLSQLFDSRAAGSLSAAQRDRVAKEIDLLERLLALYRRVADLEQTLLEEDPVPTHHEQQKRTLWPRPYYHILALTDRLTQLKESLDSPESTVGSRRRIETQIQLAKQALQQALELQQAQRAE